MFSGCAYTEMTLTKITSFRCICLKLLPYKILGVTLNDTRDVVPVSLLHDHHVSVLIGRKLKSTKNAMASPVILFIHSSIKTDQLIQKLLVG
jgi:hypothetical protein